MKEETKVALWLMISYIVIVTVVWATATHTNSLTAPIAESHSDISAAKKLYSYKAIQDTAFDRLARKLPPKVLIYNVKNIQIYKRGSFVYDVYLTERIRHQQHDYRPLTLLMLNAKSNVTFRFYINNNGGSVATLQELVHAFEATDATVEYHITGRAYSAAAMLICYADKVYSPAHTSIGFHPCQSSSSISRKICNSLYIKPMLKRCQFVGILTAEEVKIIRSGKPKNIVLPDGTIEHDSGPWIFMSGKELNDRLKAHVLRLKQQSYK